MMTVLFRWPVASAASSTLTTMPMASAAAPPYALRILMSCAGV